MPDVRDADAADEVDERVAVDVRDGRRLARGRRTIGSWTISGRATACRSRSRISRLRGPGISVRISITRVAATRGSLSVRLVGGTSCRSMDEHELDDDPIAQLTAWLDDARGRRLEAARDDARDRRHRRPALCPRRVAAEHRRPRRRLLHEPHVAQGSRAGAAIRSPRGTPLVGRSDARLGSKEPRRRRPTRSRPHTGSRRATGQPDRRVGLAAVGPPRGTCGARRIGRRGRGAIRGTGGAAPAFLGRVPHRPRSDRVLDTPRRPAPRSRALHPRGETAGAGSASRREPYRGASAPSV